MEKMDLNKLRDIISKQSLRNTPYLIDVYFKAIKKHLTVLFYCLTRQGNDLYNF